MLKTENFKYEATIDWIELEVTTKVDSNFYAIMVLFTVNYVEAIDAADGGAAKKFKFRIQDLKSWKVLDELIDRANYVKPLSSVFITAIEISFDAFSIKNDKEELIEKTAEFYWLLSNPSSANRRASGRYKGTGEALTSHASTMRKIVNEKTLYIGCQKANSEGCPKIDSISQRIYYKTTNNRKGLPIELHSARYELILQGDGCPFRTLEEAKKYNFTKLSKWFNFRKPREDMDAFMTLLLNASSQLGKVNIQRITGGGLKVNKIGTTADGALNRITYNKLRELTNRLAKKRVSRKLRATH